jgi:RNA polymerase-binding transcription factor DksA
MNKEYEQSKLILLKEKASLEKQLSGIGRRNPSNPSEWEPISKEDVDAADEGSIADNVEAIGEDTVTIEELETRVSQIDIALKAIDDGSYGICIKCGKKIEDQRLKANAAAITCIQHK